MPLRRKEQTLLLNGIAYQYVKWKDRNRAFDRGSGNDIENTPILVSVNIHEVRNRRAVINTIHRVFKIAGIRCKNEQSPLRQHYLEQLCSPFAPSETEI